MSGRGLRIDAGSLAELSTGAARAVVLPRDPARPVPREAILLRDEAGTLRAYLNRCQHLPIPLDSGSRAFMSGDGCHLQCRTHGALYRLHDGLCVQGPCAGRSLEPIPLEIEGDRVLLVLDAARFPSRRVP